MFVLDGFLNLIVTRHKLTVQNIFMRSNRIAVAEKVLNLFCEYTVYSRLIHSAYGKLVQQ
jgi:hypothetical protein